MLAVKRIALILGAASLSGAALAIQTAPPKVLNFEASGNLESPHNLGCIQFNDASPKYNPVDLFRAAKVCLDSERFEAAFELVRLAGVYGRFDVLRVADSTAHQAVTVARMVVFESVPEDVKSKFYEVAKTHTYSAEERAILCQSLKTLGPPTYRPTYMTKHGMSAFLAPNGTGVVKDFDPDRAWAEVLKSYVKCPEAG